MPNNGKHRFTDKEHRQHDHIKESEEARGVSADKADEIGWATVNKQKSANLNKWAYSWWDHQDEHKTSKVPKNDCPWCKEKPLKATSTKNAPKDSPECGAVCQMRHNGMTEEEAMSHWNNQNKKADALLKFLNKYAVDNRALDLERQIKDSNKSKTGKKYFEPSGTRKQPKTDKYKDIPKPSFKSASLTETVYNIYQEAYGVQVNPGSGGNYSMGPSVDTSPKSSIEPGQGASDSTIQWKTKDKKIPKSKLQPGMDPIIPGKVKEAPRYTMMTPDQKVNYVKDDAGNLVTNKNNGMPKTTPGKYDRSPLTEDSLKQLYPSLYEDKQPNKLRQFVDWLKGIHQQTFGGGQTSPEENGFQNPVQANQIQTFVKTAVADDNSFRIILTAMNEMGYTSGDILAAFS